MLIVITIIVILVGMATTLMRPDTEGRRIREAARMINVYISTARNRAMETGRPCGVVLETFNGTDAVMLLDQCDVPPLYCGETEGSVARVQYDSATTVRVTLQTTGGATEPLPECMVRRTDLIQFNGQGPMYSIDNTTPVGSDDTKPNFNFVLPTTSFTATVVDPMQAPSLPWTTTGTVVSYRIFRQPIKSAATPLQLPASVVVDMGASGIDGGVSFSGNTVEIVFNSNGAVDQVFAGGAHYATDPICLLVGKRERVGNTAPIPATTANQPQWANWQDMSNLWIVINPQTGLVTTEPVAAQTSISDSRSLAKQTQGMGGK